MAPLSFHAHARMSLRLRQLRRFAATSSAKPASNAISAASAFGSSVGTTAASPLPLKDQVIAVVPVTLPTVHVSVAESNAPAVVGE